MKFKEQIDYWLDREKMVLRGEFEQLYSDIEDPWKCAAESKGLSKNVFLQILFHERRFGKILDVGCGLGDFTNEIALINENSCVSAWDVSQTAIGKAKDKYPGIGFEVRDVRSVCKNSIERYDLIVLSEVLWYILDDLDHVFSWLDNVLVKQGVIGIHQYFPYDQKYGKTMLDGIIGFDLFISSKTCFSFEHHFVSKIFEDGDVLIATIKKRG